MGIVLYLLRHGETTSSQTGGYCGALDPDLTSAGYEMARDFAATYKELAWTAVYCSPLKRAVSTAKPLCEAVGLTPQLRNGLKEISYGGWESKLRRKTWVGPHSRCLQRHSRGRESRVP